jgi:hypothetical protein
MKLRLICDRCGRVVTIEMDENEKWPLSDPHGERTKKLSTACPKAGMAFCNYRLPGIDGVARKDERWIG